MFWILATLLVLMALAFVLPPLLNRSASRIDARKEQNIQIAREQMNDLEKRFENSEMDEDAYQSARDELEQALFEDIQAEQQLADGTTKTTGKLKGSLVGSLLIGLLVPLIAVGMYLQLGNPVFTKQLDSKLAAQAELEKNVPRNADGSPDIETMVSGLQKKLEAKPDNPKGWFMLGRSYMVLNRYPQAAKAFEQAYQRMPESADVMLALADALAMADNGNIAGRPTELINKSLEVDPENLTGLWLGGMASRQQGDFITAIKRWKKVLSLIADPQEAQQVETLIADTLKQLSPAEKAQFTPHQASQPSTTAVAVSETTSAKTQGITLTIDLSEKFREQVSPDDLVFIYAKALNGPPMPLAAARKQVSDLPLQIVLNDSMAMIPSMKLSAFEQVVVGARISKTGQPIAQNGDLYAEKQPVHAGERVDLTIDQVVSK